MTAKILLVALLRWEKAWMTDLQTCPSVCHGSCQFSAQAHFLKLSRFSLLYLREAELRMWVFSQQLFA